MNPDSNLNSLARTNWFAIIAEGDGAESIICCESELKQKLHAIYCVCGHDWDKCETEDIIQTIRTLDSDDSWTHDFLPNGRHIWRDRGEDYTVTVATLNGIPAVIREAIEKTLEHVEQAVANALYDDRGGMDLGRSASASTRCPESRNKTPRTRSRSQPRGTGHEMSIYDNSGWLVLSRAHDHVWADRKLPLRHRIEVCAFLHKQSLTVDPAEGAEEQEKG